MNRALDLAASTREDLIRKSWYSHDARWFNAVAEEFGMEAANRLNRKAVRAMAGVEAKRLHSALGLPPVRSVEAFLDFTVAGRDVYVPPPLIEMKTTPLDETSYEAEVTSCFVAENIAHAGIAGAYECAVWDRVYGWHASLGLPLEEMPPATTCALAKGQPCVRTIRMADTTTAATADAQYNPATK